MWTRGRVFTGRRYVEAILIENGEVVAAGTESEVRKHRSTGTEGCDLKGRLVLPGLIDAHLHLIPTTLLREGLNLSTARGPEAIREQTREWMITHPLGPVVGHGWDQDKLNPIGYPTRQMIDSLSDSRPIVLYRICHHAALLNRVALDQLGINERTPDPVGGRIGHDSFDRPNGLLFDNALMGCERFAEETFFARPESFDATLRYLASRGLTTVAPMSASPEEIRWVAERTRERRSIVRLRFYLRADRNESIEELSGIPFPRELRLTGIKAMYDGSLGARTAWLSEPYADLPGESGFPLWDPKELDRSLTRAIENGLQIAVHAIGDRALKEVLNLLEQLRQGATSRIEHASLTPPEILSELDRIRPHLVVQPGFVESDSWITQRLGASRARWSYAFRSLLDHGHRLAGSSDSPVEIADPFEGMRVAVHRAAHRILVEGEPSTEGVDPDRALQLYTVNAGEALGETNLGSLEPGSLADLLILSKTSVADALREGSRCVLESWRGGEQVFSRSPEESTT